MNIKERVQASKAMTPLQIAERSAAFKQGMTERQALKDRTANLEIQDAYNRMARLGGTGGGLRQEYQGEFNKLMARKPVMQGYNSPESAKSYKSNLKSWDEELKNLQNKMAYSELYDKDIL